MNRASIADLEHWRLQAPTERDWSIQLSHEGATINVIHHLEAYIWDERHAKMTNDEFYDDTVLTAKIQELTEPD